MMFLPDATTLDARGCSRLRGAQNTLEPGKAPIEPQRVPDLDGHGSIFTEGRTKIVAKL